VPLHLAVIDDHLNENGYIVPGLVTPEIANSERLKVDRDQVTVHS